MNKKIIFHIDVNNAFLSWSAVYLLQNGYKKDIRNIPSVIGGDEKTRRGIVLAKSPIAKKYGIVTAETIQSAKRKCPSLEIYQPNYKWYYEKSQELMKYLSQYSPNQEQMSIDECFLDMSGMKYIYKDIIKLAYQIKEEIKEKFGYTVNIGIGNNKLCAKMASDFEKPDRVHTLWETEIKSKLWPLKVNHLFMCGKKTSSELNKMGIETINDLANTDQKILERKFKSQGKYLKEASLGIDNSEVKKRDSKQKSISITETLPYNVRDVEQLKKIIFRQIEEATRELRRKDYYAKTIGVIFKNSDFLSYSAQTSLEIETNNTATFLKKAYQLIEDNYKNDPIRLIGVKLSNITEKRKEQLSLFYEAEKQESENESIQKTIDDINNRFGKTIVKPASLKIIGESKSKKKYKINDDKSDS